jgi:hypothetical protein
VAVGEVVTEVVVGGAAAEIEGIAATAGNGPSGFERDAFIMAAISFCFRAQRL